MSRTEGADHVVGRGGISLWQDAWRRLRRDRFAVLCGLAVLAYLAVGGLALLGTYVSGHRGKFSPGVNAFANRWLFADHDDARAQEENAPPTWFGSPEPQPVAATVPEDPAAEPPPPARFLLFGTNANGKDVLSRIAVGSGIAVGLGVMVGLIAVVLGAFFGSLAGWFGKVVDEGVVWLYSTVSSVPDIMLIMALGFVLGRSFTAMFLALGLTYWVGVARIVRGEFKKLRERDYVLAARALGLSNVRIMAGHVLPNVAHLLVISFSLLFVAAIKAEVVLSFLGVGIEDMPSWGIQIQDSETQLMRGQWWQITFVSVALFGIVLALQVFTDALRDALDPRLRQ